MTGNIRVLHCEQSVFKTTSVGEPTGKQVNEEQVKYIHLFLLIVREIKPSSSPTSHQLFSRSSLDISGGFPG